MATLALLADAASTANNFIDVFIYVYVLLIFVYVLTSWVRLPYSVWVRRISEFLRDVCEPFLRIFRRGEIQERIAAGPAGPLDREYVLRQRLIARRVEFFAGGVVDRDDALQPRRAEFARLKDLAGPWNNSGGAQR